VAGNSAVRIFFIPGGVSSTYFTSGAFSFLAFFGLSSASFATFASFFTFASLVFFSFFSFFSFLLSSSAVALASGADGVGCSCSCWSEYIANEVAISSLFQLSIFFSAFSCGARLSTVGAIVVG
jgi:hypothetical protein